MTAKCPGSQSFSQPKPEDAKCPFCGAEVETWSDEVKTTCTKCNKTFLREGKETCLDWCKYAKQCVGERVYKKYLENKKIKKGDKHVKPKDIKRPK